ncbi:MAG: helix-turn-helix domain-containing protein [Micromonosporaceae bacterium]
MSIGEALAEARHQAGLTVTQVSLQTRIRETIIRDIENDDYSACGGDFYARGHIRSIAKVTGADPESLIREYDTAHQAPQEMTLADIFPETPGMPGTPVETRERPRLNPTAVLALALALLMASLVALGIVAYGFLSGSRHATSAAPLARTHPVSHHPRPGPNRPATAAAPARPTVPPRTLIPARAAPLGPHGDKQGDNPQLAPLAIDRSLRTAWHTDWYTTAHFGNLYGGTGLLLDMGRPMTITKARIALGSAPGARFQLRVGTAPTPARLKTVAHTAGARGVVRLRLTRPAHGRYLLIWFTRLPPDGGGTFRVSVHDVRLAGRP